MKCITRMILWLAAVGLVLPQVPTVSAADLPLSGRPNAVSVTDVALTGDGWLHGQLVDRAGTAKSCAPVSAFSGDRLAGQAKTDQQGNFAIQLNKGGVYRLTDNETSKFVRAWTHASAPPAAAPSVLVVGDRDVVRGQDDACCPPGAGGGATVLGWVVAIGIASGVAVAALVHRHEGS
jgi:hypothetical protein